MDIESMFQALFSEEQKNDSLKQHISKDFKSPSSISESGRKKSKNNI